MPGLTTEFFAKYPNKRVCDVVFPGSHDAAITQGSSHVQTQNLEIGKQAAAGCRWFDIRILFQNTAEGIQAQAYHLPKTKYMGIELATTANKGTPDEHHHLRFGGTGQTLAAICQQAKS